MAKPYYEQEYIPEENPIPEPSFAEILKDLFFAPFKWDARSTRKAFWVALAIQCVGSSILSALIVISFLPSGYLYSGPQIRFDTVSAITIILEVIWIVLLFWLQLGLLGYAVRRLHDTNHSGWWLWLDCIPLGWLFLLYFLILPSVKKPVRWGTYLYIKQKDIVS